MTTIAVGIPAWSLLAPDFVAGGLTGAPVVPALGALDALGMEPELFPAGTGTAFEGTAGEPVDAAGIVVPAAPVAIVVLPDGIESVPPGSGVTEGPLAGAPD